MKEIRKPKIGLLGMMIGGYEPLFPGITKTQDEYSRSIASSLSALADIDFPGVACNKFEIEENVKHFNESRCDGILIVLLAYSHSNWIIRAMQDNRLPIAMAVLQPDDAVAPEFTEYDFTRNQGIHGSQDNANMLLRLGIPCQFFAGSRNSERFYKFFSDFSTAARIYTDLNTSRVLVIGKMTGMGDTISDDVKIQEKTGMDFLYASIGAIYNQMEKINNEDIQSEKKRERQLFDVESKMPEEAFDYAVRQYLATKQFLSDNGCDAFTLHFETLGEDGRFISLPFLAASNLLADGYGYAAEGDSLCAICVLAAQLVSGAASFSEMYALDYPTESILMCHAGEGNWKIARKDVKPRLVYKVFNEGGLDNPPTVLFTPEPCRATLISFAPCAEGFKIIVAAGEITDRHDLAGCEMPYLFFKPDTPIEELTERWLEFGATHHEAVVPGDVTKIFKMLSSMWKCEFEAL